MSCKDGVCSISFKDLQHIGDVTLENASIKEKHIVLTEQNHKVLKHKEICNKLNVIYEQKNKDYSDSFGIGFKEYGMAMPIIRLEDKLSRIKSLTKNKGREVKDESLIDSLNDLANYAIMTVIELEEERK